MRAIKVLKGKKRNNEDEPAQSDEELKEVRDEINKSGDTYNINRFVFVNEKYFFMDFLPSHLYESHFERIH